MAYDAYTGVDGVMAGHLQVLAIFAEGDVD
jgi:hypothetical protein